MEQAQAPCRRAAIFPIALSFSLIVLHCPFALGRSRSFAKFRMPVGIKRVEAFEMARRDAGCRNIWQMRSESELRGGGRSRAGQIEYRDCFRRQIDLRKRNAAACRKREAVVRRIDDERVVAETQLVRCTIVYERRGVAAGWAHEDLHVARVRQEKKRPFVSGRAGAGHLLGVIHRVHLQAQPDLAQVRAAGGAPCALARAGKSRKHHRREHCDYRDDDKKFDERESARALHCFSFASTDSTLPRTSTPRRRPRAALQAHGCDAEIRPYSVARFSEETGIKGMKVMGTK